MKNFIFILFLCVSCGIFAQDAPGIYTIKNVKINTSHSDFGTAFLGNDKVVFAAPKDGFTLNREEYKGQPFLDLHVAEVTEDGKLIRKQKLPGDVNTKYHEGMVTFSKDMKTVFFSANGKIKRTKRKKDKDIEVKTKGTANIHLFKASIDENGEWGNLEMLPFNDDSYSTGHPVLNRDDTKLYFVSDSPESLGRTDIFVVDVFEDGTYGQPINLGPKINTVEREMFPFIGKDNVLYYASDGFKGLGELDVYASKIFDNTVSDPINLESPVNSVSDDFAYIIDDHKHKGYFSSNRAGGKGDDDIYSFTASPPIYIECQQEITGVVRNIDTQELIPNVTIILFDEAGEKLESFMSNDDEASFSFSQSCNTNYKIQGFLEGYLVGEMDIRTVNDLNAAPIEIVLNMAIDPNRDPNAIAEAVPVEGLESEEVQQEQVIAEQSDNIESKPQSNSAANSAAMVATAAVIDQETVTDEMTDEEKVASSESSQVAGLNEESKSISEKDTEERVSKSSEKTQVVTSQTAAVNALDSSAKPKNTAPVAIAATAMALDKEGENDLNKQDENVVVEANEKVVVTHSEEAQVESSINGDVNETNTTAVIAGTGVEESINTHGDEAQVASNNTQIAGTQNEDKSTDSSLSQEAVTEDQKLSKDQAVATSETNEPNSETSLVNNNEIVGGEKEASIAVAANSKPLTKSDLAVNYEQAKVDLEGLKINSIYFDFDKHSIRYDAKIELNKLIKVMKDYPDMKIELNAHTDVRGKKKYNEGLSNKRADATSKYLVDHGVDSKRISSYWFGELRPAEKCTKEVPCSGFQHQLNRRSEFSILDKSSDQIIVKSENRKNNLNQEENSYTSNSGLFMNYNFYEDKEVYTVQVGAFKGKVQTNKYSKLTNLFNHRYDDGLNRYYSGIFQTSTEARNHMKLMRKNGYVGAFVVGLKGENRF